MRLKTRLAGDDPGCEIRVLQCRFRTASVADGVRIAIDVAKLLTQTMSVDDVLADVEIIGYRKCPSVRLAFIQSTPFIAFETCDRADDGVCSFVIRDRSFECRIVEKEAVSVSRRVYDQRRIHLRKV